MTATEKNDVLFDAMLKVAMTEAFEKEIKSMPDDAELNAYKPSPALDKRIGTLIKTHYRRMKTRRFTKSFGKAVACLCVLLTISSIILMSVGATRNAIFNAVISWREEYAEIHYDVSTSQAGMYRPTYLPAGFSEKTVESVGIIKTIVYENEAGDQIVFSQEEAGHGTTLVDNENTKYSEVKISGSPGHLFQAKIENNASILIWEENGIVFNLIAILDAKELVRIGESLKS